MATAKKAAKKSAASAPESAASSSAKTDKSAFPFPDIGSMLNQFKLPGVNVNEIIQGRKKDIEAVTEANRLAYEGMKALGMRQAEMLKEAIAEWQMVAAGMSAMSATDMTTKRTDLARQVFGKALTNMRELAEMAAKSQSQAGEVVTRRFQDNLAEMKKRLQPK